MKAVETLPVVVEAEAVQLGLVHGTTSREVVARATEAANVLTDVIKSRKLFADIGGKKYVKCEGWTTLAALMGFIPREAAMTRRDDGSYEAVAELVRISDGQVLSRASAECGAGEPLWQKRADYARRSMAATRATSKVCRLAFSWVMGMTGFQVTPFEEIPEEERHRTNGPPTAKELTEVPVPLRAPEPMPWDGKEPRPAGVSEDGEIDRGEPAPAQETLFVFRLALKAGITKQSFPAYYQEVRKRPFDGKRGLELDDISPLTAALKAKIAAAKT